MLIISKLFFLSYHKCALLEFSNLTTFFFFDLGASSFTSLTAMSLLDFTNKLLGVIKFAAEMAFDIMSPEAAVVQGKLPHPNISR